MLALACLALVSQESLTPQAKTVWSLMNQAVWKVEAKHNGEWSHIGSGFVIKHGTRFYAVTAKHVSEATITSVEGGKIVDKPFDGFRMNLDGKLLTVKFESMPKQDISACRITAQERYATIAFAGPQIGDKVYAIGYPANQSKVLSEGIVNQFIKFSDSGTLTGFSAGIWYGNSGGILLDERAECIGVTVSKYRDPAPHLFYAEPTGSTFKQFLSELK